MPHFEPPYPAGLPIGAGWTHTSETTTVLFPFDGTVVASAPLGTVELARAAIDAAVAVAPAAATLPSRLRRAVLTDVERAISANAEQLQQILVLETGKPLVDCRTEVARTITTWAAAADEVSHIHGETVPVDLQAGGQGMIGYWTRRPAGPVLGIAGFNYPLLLATHKIAPALAAGCPIICKPAPTTPLTTLWLVQLIREVLTTHGVPVEMVQLVTGDVEVSQTLVADPRIAVVSFTGSAAVGHQIARDAAPRKALLELGSNAALIVTEDADLTAAADAVIRGGFYASGQACISVQRVVVLDAVAEEFETALAARMSEVTVGDPRAPETRVAPLIDVRSTDRVLTWLAEAVDAGARVLAGGQRQGRSITPTLLADVPAESKVWAQEIFGPVVCLTTAPDLATAISVVNASRYGLQASVYTRSLATAFAAIDGLDVGGVVVNEIPGFRSDIMPYGGVKDSGIGREGPRFAIEEYMVTKMAIIRPA